MKNILSIISLLLCTASISYGMSGEDHHNPGWFWSWGQSAVRPALPYLRTLGDTATEATRSLLTPFVQPLHIADQTTGQLVINIINRATAVDLESLLKSRAQFIKSFSNVKIIQFAVVPSLNLIPLLEKYLPNLTSLTLNPLKEGQFTKLANSHFALQLRELTIETTVDFITTEATTRNFDKFARLKNLTLAFGTKDTIFDVFDALANSVLAGQLESLTINKSRLTPWSLTTNNFDKFTNLRKLDLSDSHSMKDSGFKALAKSNSAHTLEYLNVAWCGLTSLVEQDFLRFINLKSLILRGNYELSSASFSALADSRIAHNLENLDIANCNIQAKDFIEENLNKLVNLKTLDVSYNEIGNEGFIALANSNIAPQLQELNISHNDIAPEIITEHQAKFRNIKEGKLLI